MDLQNSPDFQALDVALVSIAADSTEQLVAGAQEYGISGVPLLSDPDTAVSTAYDVMQWATPGGEPSHTFVLVNQDGTIAWVQDYGHPSNRGVMYVPVDELVSEISTHLKQ
ncbi:MAG: redoxin domain-containing protein [Caldilineaceae bacterium]|nr:redoxin domain-containing protein [Caldilineaceae bacterium]